MPEGDERLVVFHQCFAGFARLVPSSFVLPHGDVPKVQLRQLLLKLAPAFPCWLGSEEITPATIPYGYLQGTR